MGDATEALRRAIEKPKNVTFWGDKYRIVPAFIDAVFGDGRALAYVTPINSRPNYYVVRVDSTWSPENSGGEPTLGRQTSAIFDAACDRWGDAGVSQFEFRLTDGLVGENVFPLRSGRRCHPPHPAHRPRHQSAPGGRQSRSC